MSDAAQHACGVLRSTREAVDRVKNQCRASTISYIIMLITERYEKDRAIYFLGIGKSGHVARRAADSWASVGLIAHYLDPVNLLHGDVGRVRSNDLIIFISQSGETKELLEANALLAANTRIAIVGDETSTLGRECDLALVTPTFGEILPFQATAAQNAWCDAIMAAWMYLHPIDLHTTHPGGSIGRQLRDRDQ